VNIDYVRLVNGEKVALRAVKEVKGGGHTGAMTGAIVATSLVFFPAAPFFLFMHGKDVTIPQGTEITAYVQGEIVLDSTHFGGNLTAGPQTVPPSAQRSPEVGSPPMTNEDVLALQKGGLSSGIIIAKIRTSPTNFRVSTSDLLSLKQAQVDAAVIQAMIEAQGRSR